MFLSSAPVSKPRVTHNCSSASARLLCDVGNDVQASVSWRLNGQETGEAGLTLSVSDKKIRPGDKYACLVKNRVSEEKSEDVHPECTGIQKKIVSLCYISYFCVCFVADKTAPNLSQLETSKSVLL